MMTAFGLAALADEVSVEGIERCANSSRRRRIGNLAQAFVSVLVDRMAPRLGWIRAIRDDIVGASTERLRPLVRTAVVVLSPRLTTPRKDQVA